MPNPQQQQAAAAAARRQTTPQTTTAAGKHAKVAADTDSQQVVKRAVLEATLTNLRSRLKDIEQDNWLYEAPRYSYH